MNSKQIAALAKRYTNAQFGPVLAQINAEYARRARAGTAAISSGTNALAAQLAPAAAQTHSAYAQAQQQQSTLDDAVLASLKGAGQSLQANLSQQVGLPTTPNVAQYGAGAGAAAFGSGSAALSKLIGQGAAAENYSGTLPSIARLGGAQHLQDMRLQLESGHQKEVGDLRAKIPGAVAQLTQDLTNQDLQRAIATQSGLLGAAKLQETSSYHAATIAARNRATNKAYDARMASIRASATKSGRTYNDNLSRSAGHAVDAQGRPIINPSTGQPYRYVPKPSSKKGPAALSQTAVSKMKSNAIEAAKAFKHGQPNPNYDPNSDNYHNGLPDKQQFKIPPNSHKPAWVMRYLRRHGVRDDIARWAVGQIYGG